MMQVECKGQCEECPNECKFGYTFNLEVGTVEIEDIKLETPEIIDLTEWLNEFPG